jgi:hypothetical protein
LGHTVEDGGEVIAEARGSHSEQARDTDAREGIVHRRQAALLPARLRVTRLHIVHLIFAETTTNILPW